MVPPWAASHANEWSASNGLTQVPPLPYFGKKEEGEPAQDQGVSHQNPVKQEEDVKFESLDDYLCRGMDSSGPASWDKILSCCFGFVHVRFIGQKKVFSMPKSDVQKKYF